MKLFNLLFLISTTFFFTCESKAQEIIWAKHLAGNYSVVKNTGLSISQNGTIAIIGNPFFTETYNSNGDFKWRLTGYNRYGYCSAGIVKQDEKGNIYVTGTFKGVQTFQDYYFYSPTEETDAFIMKINAEGDIIYCHNFSGGNRDYISSMTVDDEGNCFISGKLSYPHVIGDTETTFLKNSSGEFLIKLNPEGKMENKHAILQCFDEMELTKHGDLMVKGSYYNKYSFPNDTINDSGGSGIFIAKLNDGEVLEWCSRIRTKNSLYFNELTIADDQGSVSLYFESINDFELPNGQIHPVDSFQQGLIFLNSAGELKWVNAFNHGSLDFSKSSSAMKNNGSIALYGYSHECLNHGEYNCDLIRCQFNPNTGMVYDTLIYNEFTAPGNIVINSNNEIFIYGEFQSVLTLGPVTLEGYAFGKSPYLAKFKEVKSPIINEFNYGIYPIPCENKLTITHDPNSSILKEFQIFSLNGRILKQGVINEYNYSVDTSTLPNGVYFLKIEDEVHRIIKYSHQ